MVPATAGAPLPAAADASRGAAAGGTPAARHVTLVATVPPAGVRVTVVVVAGATLGGVDPADVRTTPEGASAPALDAEGCAELTVLRMGALAAAAAAAEGASAWPWLSTRRTPPRGDGGPAAWPSGAAPALAWSVMDGAGAPKACRGAGALVLEDVEGAGSRGCCCEEEEEGPAGSSSQGARWTLRCVGVKATNATGRWTLQAVLFGLPAHQTRA